MDEGLDVLESALSAVAGKKGAIARTGVPDQHVYVGTAALGCPAEKQRFALA
jgi:hypothetical protein